MKEFFSIVDILEGNMKKWENVLPYYQNVKREELFYGKQPKGIGRIPFSKGQRNAVGIGKQPEDRTV